MMQYKLSFLIVVFGVSTSLMSVDSGTKAKCGCNASGLNHSYDFIIIGGGSAGCLLANRLSKVTYWSILLLEAGEDESFSSKVPFFPVQLQKTRLDWNFTSTKQANACQSLGGYCEVPRGRVLGGSSSINYMMHMRGLQEDFDTWEAEGNQGWSYRELLPFFQKIETRVTPTDSIENKNGDLLPVKEVEPDWWSNVFSTALSEFGLNQADLNQGFGRGFMLFKVNVRNGARVSANTAFLKPAMKRPNLVVLTSSLVKRILIDNQTAIGVEFEHENKTFSVFASKEVILSAGSIKSPQILMLSGIGPADELKQFGLPVVKDLPVGWSLQDHVGISTEFLIKNQTTKPKDDAMESIQQYLYNQTGLLGMPDGRIVALMNSSATSNSSDMELIFGRGAEDNVFYINGFLAKPESRGKLTLRSDSPYDPPLIDLNFLGTERDSKIMRKIVETIFELVSSTSLKNLEPFYNAPNPWLCGNSTDFIGCLFKQYSITFYHPVSTCKMGPTTDSYAVVDSELKVYGVNGLRVVDASVMPHVPSTNINAPTLAVAEKASSMIIHDHKCG